MRDVKTLEIALRDAQSQRDFARELLDQYRRNEAQSRYAALVTASESRTVETDDGPRRVVVLDSYQRDNLAWLLDLVSRTEPFNAADTGDWVAEIRGMLGEDADPGNANVDDAEAQRRIMWSGWRRRGEE